ncbi:MAG: glutathione S-transferase [Sphingomonadales bacterium]|nr:glutathione S-transferase [Sphingomonadales bacterium]
MLTVHHLNESRSQRILWLLEELDLPYDIKFYQRDAKTRLAPPELKAVHPLGKSPVVTDDGETIIESGAIVDYVIRKYGNGRLQPAVDDPNYTRYVEWLHYAEGSAMLPLLLKMYTSRLPDGGQALQPRIADELANHLGYVERSLEGRDYLLGDITGADIQMSFVGEFAGVFGQRATHPNINAWVKRCQARPAYRRALERGGPYPLAD